MEALFLMKPMVIRMEPLGNAASVRKYYRNHRDAIITRKTLHACSQDGRIPRCATVPKHKIPSMAVLNAFAAWRATRPTTDVELQKRDMRMRALMQTAWVPPR